jgi:hypothetical protein
MGFCAFLEDHKNAQNPTRNFQKCTTLYQELTTMHKIPRGTSKYAQNPTRIFQKCTKSHGFCAYLEVPRGILCIFVSSSYNVVHFWKFLVIFCAFLEFPHGKGYTCPFDPFTLSSIGHLNQSLLIVEIAKIKYVKNHIIS